MFLAGLSDIITVPFGWLLGRLYDLLGNYGLAMILFSVVVQLVLLPITAKSKKSMMKMARIQPKILQIQKKYANDQAKQSEAIQALQREEGASMGMGGCLWSFVPLLILFPLYSVIREPLTYMLGASEELVAQIAATAGVSATTNANYQVEAIKAMMADPAAFRNLPGMTAQILRGVDFTFLGLDLGATPQFNVFAWSSWSWGNIGLFLLPCISAGLQVLQVKFSQRMNDSVITDENGVQDREAAANSQTAQTNKMMTWMMPAMSVLIGFAVPAGLSICWLVGGVVRTVEDAFLTRHYRKIYDAEDAIKLQAAREREAEEAEKERIRAERRAANPDGITTNTSKKKLQQKQRNEELAAKQAAAREYALRRGLPVEEERVQDKSMSGIPERPYCKGRNYDPDRYRSNDMEE